MKVTILTADALRVRREIRDMGRRGYRRVDNLAAFGSAPEYGHRIADAKVTGDGQRLWVKIEKTKG